MEKIGNLLDQLIEKLEEEKNLLIESIKDSSVSEKLMKVVEEKRGILSELSQFSAEELEPFQDKLETIQSMSKINLNIAANNAQFIEELFNMIFDEPQKYDQTGSIKGKQQKGFINKKI
ncbi:hypothetical protein [Persephonella sp. KM09-Lau-8]|uniref:hypothetical protein n=1 Tax=Persephonella sp. KM09-Lau-8 TaxID=1158345 RepID=UPI000495404C|nr:hypothetical protein [Persephonella sp. KM09-Lau-8]